MPHDTSGASPRNRPSTNSRRFGMTTLIKSRPTVPRALHPPTGGPPPSVQGITEPPQLVFCIAIRLLTDHTFTGEYTARHCPRPPGPPGCHCGTTPLQTSTTFSPSAPYSRQPESAISFQPHPITQHYLWHQSRRSSTCQAHQGVTGLCPAEETGLARGPQLSVLGR
jgi:hypothetical protein